MSKAIPEFQSEEEERQFWAEHDSAGLLDWQQSKAARFPNLKPSTRVISLRLPESMLEELRILANKNDVPYQSLIKMILHERLEREFRSSEK